MNSKSKVKKEEQIRQLNEFIKTSALNIIELERTLIKTLGADDANEELDELQERIEKWDEKIDGADDGRGTIRQRMSIIKNTAPQVLPKKNLSPERAIFFALKSLNSSIEFFGEERELFLSKQEAAKKQLAQKEEEWKQKIIEMEQKVKEANEERDEIQEQNGRQAEQIERLKDLNDQYEEFDTERESLNEKCQGLEAQITELESEKDTLELKCHQLEFALDEAENRVPDVPQDDEESNEAFDVGMLQNRIDELEKDNSKLAVQVDEQIDTIIKLKKEKRLSKFDDKLQGKADDFKAEEYIKKYDELRAEHTGLQAQCRFQERQIDELNQSMAAKDLSMEVMRDQRETQRENELLKIKALEDALQAMGDERSKLLSQNQDIEDERQMLLFKCQAQQDAILAVKEKSGLLKKEVDFDPNNATMEEITDDRERLAHRCNSLEVHIGVLENEITVLKSKSLAKDQIIKDLEQFTSTVSDEQTGSESDSNAPGDP